VATVEELMQDIIDWVNTNQGSTYGHASFSSAFYDFIEDLTWRDAEIELRSGTAKVVEFIDAGEGDYSADTRLVFSVNEQLFRVDGHYESWAGSEWNSDDIYEVSPVPVVVIEYQRKDLNGI
jgi:hypothetical protein